MKKRYSEIALVLSVIFILSACSGNSGNMPEPPRDTAPDNTATSTPPPSRPTEPLPSYTFEEILRTQPTRFNERGDKITVDVSGEHNYYGEITIAGSRLSSGSTLDGTYALFIVDEGNVTLRVTIRDDGYYSMFDLQGMVSGGAVEFDGTLYGHNSNPITQVARNFERNTNTNGIRLLRVDWGRNSGSSEWNFVMLSVVITKEEAIRYVQDGTLPSALQGLTVTGLDEIFRNPEEITGSRESENTTASAFENLVSVIVPPTYGNAMSFSEGMAAVAENMNYNWGYINTEGDLVIPLQYREVKSFSDGLAAVLQSNSDGDNGWGFIDKVGNVIVPFGRYDFVESFSEGFAAVGNRNGGYWFIDTQGNEVMAYATTRPFSDGLALVGVHDEGLCFIDRAGNIVIPSTLLQDYSHIESFSGGLAAVRMHQYPLGPRDTGGKWGFIDKTGNLVIQPAYDEAREFSEGFAAVNTGGLGSRGGRWGFISKDGTEVIPRQYYEVDDFSDGTALVTKVRSNDRGEQVLIDIQGNEIRTFDSRIVDGFSEGFSTTIEHWLINKEGTINLQSPDDFYFERFTRETEMRFSEGFAIIVSDYKYGYVRISQSE